MLTAAEDLGVEILILGTVPEGRVDARIGPSQEA